MLTASNDRIKVGYEEVVAALSDPQWETVEAKKLYPTHYGQSAESFRDTIERDSYGRHTDNRV